jgi:hypothetical protein
LARNCGADIDSQHVGNLLNNWPGLRHTILFWWRHSTRPSSNLDVLVSYVTKGAIVDDATPIEIANALIAARLPKTPAIQSKLDEILDSLDTNNQWSLYARIWLLSKYGDINRLMKTIEATTSIWMTEEHLCRVVAGMFPRFYGSVLQRKFEAIVRRSANNWSQSVIDFHQQLCVGTSGYTSIKPFVTAGNPSFPNKLSHSKFLMLLSLLQNKSIAPTAVGTLKALHAYAFTDPYYRTLIP